MIVAFAVRRPITSRENPRPDIFEQHHDDQSPPSEVKNKPHATWRISTRSLLESRGDGWIIVEAQLQRLRVLPPISHRIPNCGICWVFNRALLPSPGRVCRMLKLNEKDKTDKNRYQQIQGFSYFHQQFSERE